MPGMISTATGSVSVDPTAESLLHRLGKSSFVCFVSLLLPIPIVWPSSVLEYYKTHVRAGVAARTCLPGALVCFLGTAFSCTQELQM